MILEITSAKLENNELSQFESVSTRESFSGAGGGKRFAASGVKQAQKKL
jgi:hypothetical protein